MNIHTNEILLIQFTTIARIVNLKQNLVSDVTKIFNTEN